MTTQTVTLKMTWANVAPMLAAILEDGNATGRANAREELARMARVADLAKGWAADVARLREGLKTIEDAAQLAAAANVSRADALGELRELAKLAAALRAEEAPTAAPEGVPG